MQPHEKLYAKRQRRAFGGSVEGQGSSRRLDRKASGGSIREQFNAAAHDQPARPTIDEPGALPAVHNRAGGGRLTAGERQRMPKSDFALPGKGKGPKGAGAGSYPIEDRSHAVNALARVSQHGSSAQKAAVRAKVHAKYPDIGRGD